MLHISPSFDTYLYKNCTNLRIIKRIFQAFKPIYKIVFENIALVNVEKSEYLEGLFRFISAITIESKEGKLQFSEKGKIH